MAVDFIDLHAHSQYSFLDGHPSPEEMVEKAVSLGRQALALTDHGSVSGHVLFEKAISGYSQKTIGANTMFTRDGEARALKPIFGLEAYTSPDSLGRGKEFQKKFHLSVLAKNLKGYQNLMQLVTRSFSEGFYYRQSIDGDMLLAQREGLIVLSGCESGNFMRKLEANDWDGARELASTFQSVFGDDFYIEVQHFPHMGEKSLWAWAIAEELGIKTVLTCDSHYLDPDGWKYQQFLWSIRDGKPAEKDGFKIEHAYMWAPDELMAFCQLNSPQIGWEQIFENTVECGLKTEHYKMPRAPHVVFPMEGDKIEYIAAVATSFLQERGLYTTEYIDRMTRELEAIANKSYEDYFLVVADMIGWAKKAGIFVGPARGSAAGSLICWALRITEIDPVRFGLLFERFVDPTRVDLPDIDCDFEDDRRHEVFDYMEQRWGRDQVAFISTFARLQGKSALDAVAKSYRIPAADIDIIKRHLVERSSGDQRAELTIEDTLAEFPEAREVYERYPALNIAAGVEGRVRHTGKHAAGLIVTSEPITDYIAVVGQDERLIACDWRDSQYLNLMKIDCLGLKELKLFSLMCGAIGMTLDDLYNLPFDDSATFDGFNAHDFLGIFQFTGLATKGVASRVHFTELVQIADVNALSRPGPLHAGATESYLRGHASGSYQPILPQEIVQPIIGQTFGQIIYQEQVMRILRDAGDMSWQDVCDIRNIMGKTKGSEAMDKFKPRWLEGTASQGLPERDAMQIWETIRLYGKHSFNKSHALAYGIVAYWSMWFKQRYPREFYWSQLVKDKADIAPRFIMEAMRKGIEFAPFGLAVSEPDWGLIDGRIAPGWTAIKGIGPKAGEELAKHAPFSDMDDLRARVNKRIVHQGIQTLIEANIGKTVEEIYSLHLWKVIQERFPFRQSIIEVNEGNVWESKFSVVGRVTHINKKNRVEEWKSKGRDTTQLEASGKLTDYVILILEDETDSTMVWISPELYFKIKDIVWDWQGKFLCVTGFKMPNVQLVSAQQLELAIIDSSGAVIPGKTISQPSQKTIAAQAQ